MTGPAPLEGAREALRAEIEKLWRCTCHEAYKVRNRIDPQCPFCDYIEDVLDAIPAALSSSGYQVVKVEEQSTMRGFVQPDGRVTIPYGVVVDVTHATHERQVWVGPWVPVSGEGRDD